MLRDATGLRALGLVVLLATALAACNRSEAERTGAPTGALLPWALIAVRVKGSIPLP